MSETITNKFQRNYLKRTLKQCPSPMQHVFKRMYADPKIKDKRALDINNVVDKMSAKKLDWAIRQVDLTIIDVLANYTNWENYCQDAVNHPLSIRVI